MLSDMSWTQKDKYCTIPLIRAAIGQFIETKSRIEVPRGWRKGEKGRYYLVAIAFKLGMIPSTGYR